jgi:hypothetical protein
MPKQKQKRPAATGIRMSTEDEKIVAALVKKKGGNFSSVTREAWRVLAAKEQLSFSA